jgi:streptogramin lyase
VTTIRIVPEPTPGTAQTPVARPRSLWDSEAMGERLRRVRINRKAIYSGAGAVLLLTPVLVSQSYVRPGDGGPAAKAAIDGPARLVFDTQGNLFVYEASGDRPPAIRKIAAGTQTITTLLIGCDRNRYPSERGNCLGPITEMRMDGAGQLLLVESTDNRVRSFDLRSKTLSLVAGNGSLKSSGDAGPATAAGINAPRCAATDRQGNIFVCDSDRIRKIDPRTGAISTVAGNGKAGSGGDHGPALDAQLYFPKSIALDDDGNRFIADGTARIRKVDARTGIIAAIAGTARPNRLAPSNSSLVECLAFDGDGKAALEADLCTPSQLLFDRQGNLLFVDEEGPVNRETRICKINRESGKISVIAGMGKTGFSGDGGLATRAQIDVLGAALDSNGNLFLADWQHNRIRRVDAATGRINTFAGNGQPEKGPPGGFF